MIRFGLSRRVFLATMAVLLAASCTAHGQIVGILDTRAAGYFSTDNQFNLGGLANFFSDPAGQLPPAPGTYPNPPFLTGNALPGVLGVDYVNMPQSYFGNNVTGAGTTVTATAITAGFFNNGFLNSPNDALVIVPNNSVLSTTALLQAYTQINFSVDYDIGAAFGLNAGNAQATYTTVYNVQNIAGSFAAFDATAWYWRVNALGVPQALLGSLNLNFFTGPGTAGLAILNDVQFIGGITPAQAAAGDNLRVVGYLRMEVDPASISITTVPEPTTLALFGLVGVGCFGYYRQRRQKSLLANARAQASDQ